MLSPRGSGREPTGYDGRSERGAVGQRISALVLLILCRERACQKQQVGMARAGCTPARREYRCDVSTGAALPTPDLPEPHLATTRNKKEVDRAWTGQSTVCLGKERAAHASRYNASTTKAHRADAVPAAPAARTATDSKTQQNEQPPGT